MKVAVVHNFHSADVPSGENAVVEAETAALARAGHDVRVASVHNDQFAEQRLHQLRGAATVATGIGRSPLRLLGDFRPDVIHVHSLFPYFGSRWVERAPAAVVATLHNYRPICANGYFYRDGEVCTLCADGLRWSGVRYGCYRNPVATIPLAIAGRRGAAHDPLLRHARLLLALSERAHSVYVAAGVPESKLRVDWHFLPDSLDPGIGAARDDSWLFVGRLTPEKGVDRLVQEWPADVSLRIVGEGPLRSTLEGLAVGKRIELLGQRPRLEVVEAMRSSFGFVFPSRWYETFGLAYMEALACGLPTLAFPPTVVADFVERDGTGLVGTWGSIAASVRIAGESFEDLRQHCRAVFEERYTEGAFVERRRRLYAEVRGSGVGAISDR